MKKLYFLILCAAAILFAGCNGNEPTVSKNVHLTGYKIYKMPARDKCYMVVMYPQTINDDYMSAISTPISDKLVYADLPYTKMCADAQYLEDLAYMKNYRIILAYGDKRDLASMQGYAEWNLNPNAIQEECTFTSTDGKAKIGLLFSIR